MRFRPANISLINRRHYLPRLLLILSSCQRNDQRTLTGHYISLPVWPRLDRSSSSCGRKPLSCKMWYENRANEMKRINVAGVLLTWLLIAANSVSQSSGLPQAPAPDFVTDSAIPTQSEELRRDVEVLNNAQCNGHYIYLDRPTTIGDFVVAKTKTVRVTRPVTPTDSSAETSVLQILKKVWTGQFRSASCQIDWAEFTSWSVEGVVEFEDGTRGRLITDGFHVVLQDHAGKNWFIRLLPAAQ